MSIARTKGTHVINAVKVLRLQPERARALLPPALHKYLEQRILPSSWYPLDEHLTLLRTVVQLMPSAPGQDPWALMGRGTAMMDLNGIYKQHLKAGDPPRTLVAMGALWRSAQDTGEVGVTFDEAARATVTLRDFGLRSREFCRITTGYLAAVIELAGGKEIRVDHTRCRVDGTPTCVWQVAWSL